MKKFFYTCWTLWLALFAATLVFGAIVRSPEPPHDFKNATTPDMDRLHSCKLSWTYPTDKSVLGIHVYAASGADPNNVVMFDALWAKSIVMDDLDDHTTYFFCIKSYDKNGTESVVSNVIKWHAPANSPNDGSL